MTNRLDDYSRIFESYPDAVFIIDKEGNILTGNREANVLTGLDQMTIERVKYTDIVFASDQTCATNYFKQALQGGIKTGNLKILHKDGTFKYIEITVAALMDKTEVLGVYWIVKEINENKTVPTSYHTEKYYAPLFYNNPDLVYCLDLEGNFIEVNPALERVSGLSMNKILSMNFMEVLLPSERERVLQYFFETCKGSPKNYETVIVVKNAQEIYLEVKNIPIFEGDQVVGVFGIAKDMTTRKQLEEKIAHLAYFDSLTGLIGRELFYEKVDESIKKSKIDDKPLAVLFIDLDNFKDINDKYGHHVGDAVLKDVAILLHDLSGEKYVTCRLGGDEFVIMLEDVTKGQISHFAKNLLELFHRPFYHDGYEVFLAASIGIVLYPDSNIDDDVHSLIKKADQAMFLSKELGKNEFRFYSQDLQIRLSRKKLIEQELQRALADDHFELHYQSKYNLLSEKLIGAEALIRWNHPQMGRIPPNEFIPIAEETGLIIQIGQWVIEEVCKQVSTWNKQGYPAIQISLNLSMRQLTEDIVHIMKKQINKYKINPMYIELELTESIMQYKERSIRLLNNLKSLGVSLSIDDFGTGYSSLRYLKNLPVDTLKIDQSFVADLPNGDKDLAIAGSIINLAKNFNLKVIAEGIEKREQLEALKELFCDQGQGYFFSKPLSVKDFEDQILNTTKEETSTL